MSPSSQSPSAVHSTTQLPLEHRPGSPPLVQEVPSVTSTLWQSLLASQVLVVQGLPSSQAASLVTCWQPELALHVSVVQPTPSSHDESTGVFVQLPVLVLQESVVHGIESSQSPSPVQPTMQEPPMHVPGLELESVHDIPSATSLD